MNPQLSPLSAPAEPPLSRAFRLVVFFLALILLGALVAACAPISPARAQAAWSGSELLARRAMTIAGRVVLNAEVGTLRDSDADFLDAAAAGLRSGMPDLVTGDDVAAVVRSWTPAGPQWARLAVELGAAFDTGRRAGAREAVLEALAAGLNAAAASDRQP